MVLVRTHTNTRKGVNALKGLLNRFGVMFYAVCVLMAVAAAQASAYTQEVEYAPVTENVGSEIGAAVPIALAAVGVFVGILIAYKLVRRMLRA